MLDSVDDDGTSDAADNSDSDDGIVLKINWEIAHQWILQTCIIVIFIIIGFCFHYYYNCCFYQSWIFLLIIVAELWYMLIISIFIAKLLN